MKIIPSAKSKVRNWDLIREILINISEDKIREFVKEQSNISYEALSYNIQLLINEDYITDFSLIPMIGSTPNIISSTPIELKWKGNDLLDSIKDENIWSKVKSKMEKVGGSVAVDILKSTAQAIVAAQLSLNP